MTLKQQTNAWTQPLLISLLEITWCIPLLIKARSPRLTSRRTSASSSSTVRVHPRKETKLTMTVDSGVFGGISASDSRLSYCASQYGKPFDTAEDFIERGDFNGSWNRVHDWDVEEVSFPAHSSNGWEHVHPQVMGRVWWAVSVLDNVHMLRFQQVKWIPWWTVWHN